MFLLRYATEAALVLVKSVSDESAQPNGQYTLTTVVSEVVRFVTPLDLTVYAGLFLS